MYLQQNMAKNKTVLNCEIITIVGTPWFISWGAWVLLESFFLNCALLWYSDRAYHLYCFKKKKVREQLAWLPASLLVEGSVSLWNTCQHFLGLCQPLLLEIWKLKSRPSNFAFRSLMIFVSSSACTFSLPCAAQELQSSMLLPDPLLPALLHILCLHCSGCFSRLPFYLEKLIPIEPGKRKDKTQSRIWLLRVFPGFLSLLPSFSEVVPLLPSKHLNTPALGGNN